MARNRTLPTNPLIGAGSVGNGTLKVRGDTIDGVAAFYKVTSHGPVDLLQDGSWSQKYTFECDWASLFKYMPVRGFTRSPDFAGLLCDSASAAFKAPGIAVVVVTFRGIPFQLPPGDEEMIVSTSEEPIETHPYFIKYLAGKPSAPLIGAVFTGTDDDNDTFVKFNQKSQYAGVESYLAPTMTFRRNYSDFNRPDISRVGYIWHPEDAPSGGGNRNWLCAGITWRKYGGYYSINEDSLLSGPRGWLPILYTYPGTISYTSNPEV